LDQTGVINAIAALLQQTATRSPDAAAWSAGLVTAFVSNIANNLPVGLFAASAVASAQPPDQVTRAVLIGVDLGPNLSVTGSLATILWLTALRRDGQTVGALAFLQLGVLVMPPALVLALAGALVLP
jgi:arsenical pump membrane protein